MKKGGFTLVEIIVVVVVVAILSTIVVARYNGSQERAARSLVYSNIDRAASVMETYQVPSSDYPPNLAGTDYVQSDGVSVALFTDAQQVRTYAPGSLNADQNAQLFLFACNAAMPIQDFPRALFSGEPSAQGMLSFAQMTDDVFNHHHRAVDDQAEVHGTETHQVS